VLLLAPAAMADRPSREKREKSNRHRPPAAERAKSRYISSGSPRHDADSGREPEREKAAHDAKLDFSALARVLRSRLDR
jgi:hypothetical protein